MVLYPLRGPFSSVARYNVLIFSTSASLQKSHTLSEEPYDHRGLYHRVVLRGR